MANKIPSKRDNTIRRINAYCGLIQSKPKEFQQRKYPNKTEKVIEEVIKLLIQ